MSKIITTKKELIDSLEQFSDSDIVVIEVHDCTLTEDLYKFYIDPINLELDKDGNERGYEIRICAVPHEKNPDNINAYKRILASQLSHFYELDLDNCTMSHKNWIDEITSAMYDEDFYLNFQKEYSQYKKERE